MLTSLRPQKIELGATGGASKQQSSNMAEMTVEEMAMRANQVTDEVGTRNPSDRLKTHLFNVSLSSFSCVNYSLSCYELFASYNKCVVDSDPSRRVEGILRIFQGCRCLKMLDNHL